MEAYIRAALRNKNPDRPLDTNVEFFTAILLDALKIPRQAFTPIFGRRPRRRLDRACARAAAQWALDPAELGVFGPMPGCEAIADLISAERRWTTQNSAVVRP